MVSNIFYKGVDIKVYDQSICIVGATSFWLGRPVEDRDITSVKKIIDAGRRTMAQDIKQVEKLSQELIEECDE